LVACEYSGRVRSAFRALGHDAWSCDLEPAADDSPHHRLGDCIPVIAEGWDLVLAFPPCTYLCNSGLHHNARQPMRALKTEDAARFFMQIAYSCNTWAKAWAIENPVGTMSTRYRKPDQIVQPYEYGDSAKKTTCLWLHKLKNLAPTNIVDPGAFVTNPDGRKYPAWMTTKGKHRSVTFPGIARAMAEQWGGK
jgi:hypothetical protein